MLYINIKKISFRRSSNPPTPFFILGGIYCIMGKFVITEEEKNRIKNLYEQLGPLMSFGSRNTTTPRFNLEKGSRMTGARRLPDTEEDTPGPDLTCYDENIKKLVTYCKNNEYKFKPDNESKQIVIKLHNNIDGISFGGAIDTLKTIKDEIQFCKVANGYRYDGEDLAKQMSDEISLQGDIVWRVIKKFSTKFGIPDLCDKKQWS